MKKKDKRRGPRSPALRKKMSLAQKRRRQKAIDEWINHVEDKHSQPLPEMLGKSKSHEFDIVPDPSLITSIVVGLKSILSGLWR